MTAKKVRIISLLFGILSFANISGQVKLPSLISDGMVLQHDKPLQLWGWASAGEAVMIELAGKTYNTKADKDGKWLVKVPPHPAGGPFNMTIKGKNTLTVNDILFGDVWICSGQSNMELTMERVKEKYKREISEARNEFIRHFTVPDAYDFNRLHDDVDAKWIKTTPEAVLGFSAVAYFFAEEVHQRTGIPIGLINAALGGSPVEAWMSEDALRPFPEAFAEYKKFKDDKLIKEIEQTDRERAAKWYAELNAKDAGLRGRWKTASDDSEWKRVSLPGYWSESGYHSGNGVVWFRKEVDVPSTMTNAPAMLWMGRLIDQDSVFVNGRFAGTTGYQYPPRRYSLPADMLRAGKNIITVRLINQGGMGGFVPGKRYYLASGNDTISLEGDWGFRVGAEMQPLQGGTFVRWKPVGLFNRMIHPLLKYSIRGALWYQGESNTSNPSAYNAMLTAMINDWRTKWNQGDFPFLMVQLPNHGPLQKEPGESNWAELRQAQLNSLKVPNTAMAVTIDLGEWNDIHPLDKKGVGVRLALLARKNVYNEKALVASGPLPESAVFRKDRILVTFSHAPGGLVADKPIMVSISSDGKLFKWVEARIESNMLVVDCGHAPNPTVVRYAWAENPAHAHLRNREGLPASPFQLKKAGL